MPISSRLHSLWRFQEEFCPLLCLASSALGVLWLEAPNHSLSSLQRSPYSSAHPLCVLYMVVNPGWSHTTVFNLITSRSFSKWSLIHRLQGIEYRPVFCRAGCTTLPLLYDPWLEDSKIAELPPQGKWWAFPLTSFTTRGTLIISQSCFRGQRKDLILTGHISVLPRRYALMTFNMQCFNMFELVQYVKKCNIFTQKSYSSGSSHRVRSPPISSQQHGWRLLLMTRLQSSLRLPAYLMTILLAAWPWEPWLGSFYPWAQHRGQLITGT